ncbi:hypothetical protein L3X38_010258 [Prunus dulcis]|uniref:Uncharacterized protein n=1 Tax=Prunus dulcis TaxID=3755 RepID=A0AAD4ZEL2_PRUDU|nr:hypothetical protein L3X38_010258 [Prunus dulcis]
MAPNEPLTTNCSTSSSTGAGTGTSSCPSWGSYPLCRDNCLVPLRTPPRLGPFCTVTKHGFQENEHAQSAKSTGSETQCSDTKLTGPDPNSALEFESDPVRVRHLANVGHKRLICPSSYKLNFNLALTPIENLAESPL